MGNETKTQHYEVLGRWSASDIQGKAEEVLSVSKPELIAILVQHGISSQSAPDLAKAVSGMQVEVDFAGRGSTADVIAIAVSLTPLVQALVPLLQPFSNAAAELALLVAKDIWEMTKRKLWYDHQIKLNRTENP